MSTSNPNDEYIPRDDESEAARVASINGIGEIQFDVDDAKSYAMADFGLGIPEEYKSP